MIKLRAITNQDLENYGYWKLPIHQYHELNGPYFKKKTKEEIHLEIDELKVQFSEGNENPLPRAKIISNDENELIGEVSWYWKSEETLWLEIGIVIFSENNWKKGIGQQALTLWINELFETNQAIVRLGLTTWSGNSGMLKLAERLGMKKEAVYRKARIVNGNYYDSVSYGILKTEW
jgi:putative hydrolase of HD superfamily